jgi:hypothetical protein
MSARKFKPCKCGCGRDTGSRHREWVRGHFDFVARSDMWERTRRANVTRKRVEKFKAIARSLGRRISQGELMAAFQEVDVRAYRSGFLAGQKCALSQRKLEDGVGENNTIIAAVSRNAA